jgi:hypothetical protein
MPRPVGDDSRPLTWDHLKKVKKPLEIRVPVYTDGEPIERLEKVRIELEAAKTRSLALKGTPGEAVAKADLDRLEAEEADAVAAVKATTKHFVIRKITPRGRKRYEETVEAHPPTDEQVAEAKANGQDRPPYNAETFAPALLSMSCSEPLLSVEEATELFDDWSITECSELFSACLAVNTGRRTVDLGKG